MGPYGGSGTLLSAGTSAWPLAKSSAPSSVRLRAPSHLGRRFGSLALGQQTPGVLGESAPILAAHFSVIHPPATHPPVIHPLEKMEICPGDDGDQQGRQSLSLTTSELAKRARGTTSSGII